jgi:hypothetical protein
MVSASSELLAETKIRSNQAEKNINGLSPGSQVPDSPISYYSLPQISA